jgi:Ca2+-binding EF-hand superfamily protein
MEISEVWHNHDFDNSGCINFCEFMFVYKCNAEHQDWTTSLTGADFEELYKRIDADDDCCLDYDEFELVINTFGGIKEEFCDDHADQCKVDLE